MVRHRRFEPIEHGFRYRIQLLYLDLDETPTLFGRSRLWSCEGRTPISFRRADHLGPPETTLRESVQRLLTSRLGWQPHGPIRILTSPRYLGVVFNPVSLYYCFDASGDRLEALVAEVTNTPWGERHCYALDLRNARRPGHSMLARRTKKAFHVSPFMEMEMSYEWRVGLPGRSLTLSIHTELSDRAPSPRRAYEAPYFQADLALNRREIEGANLRRAFRSEPFLSGRMLLAIYWQALRLWLRRVPLIRHPETSWPRDLADPRLIEETPPAIAEASG